MALEPPPAGRMEASVAADLTDLDGKLDLPLYSRSHVPGEGDAAGPLSGEDRIRRVARVTRPPADVGLGGQHAIGDGIVEEELSAALGRRVAEGIDRPHLGVDVDDAAA